MVNREWSIRNSGEQIQNYSPLITHYTIFFNFTITSPAQPSRLFFISCSQKRITVQPCLISICVTSISRCIFLSIFGIQYALFVASFFFFCSQSYPCQKSPSTNTAILYFVNMISGLPINFFEYILYL